MGVAALLTSSVAWALRAIAVGPTVETGAGVVAIRMPVTTTEPVMGVADMVATPTVMDMLAMGLATLAGMSEPPWCTVSISGESGSWGRDGAILLLSGKDIDARKARKMNASCYEGLSRVFLARNSMVSSVKPGSHRNVKISENRLFYCSF